MDESKIEKPKIKEEGMGEEKKEISAAEKEKEKKVLLIDDALYQKDKQYFFREPGRLPDKEVLKDTDLNIELVGDVESALERLKQGSRYDRIIIDLNLPGSTSKEKEEEFRKELYTFASKSNVNALAEAYPAYRPIRGGGKWEPDLELDPELFSPQNPKLYSPPFGVLVAYECKKRKIPFTVYTSDFGHGSVGIKLLACLDIISPEIIADTLRKHRVVENESEEERRSQMTVSEDNSFAMGYKWAVKNWDRLASKVSQLIE